MGRRHKIAYTKSTAILVINSCDAILLLNSNVDIIYTYRFGITEGDVAKIKHSLITHGSVWFAKCGRIRVGNAFCYQENGQVAAEHDRGAGDLHHLCY